MKNTIQLKKKESKHIPHFGYGEGKGLIIEEKYECPCRKGTVYYDKDDIPGFRDKHIYSDCDECNEKYSFSRGIAMPK
ncbi:hypothetical protein DX933_15795 [Ornithinibacillus gellani]|uniref:hypothetical protein n=1 Tax=Ornithinibacillus gellani TaxID=2293253 RepID=UPI000F47BCED|nr:hypothetical protein [Ornithinibacillus gellani]TQS71142.1 hypothetical protein DX933_15795 [Ornithinibacillus gellani]